MSSHFLFVVCQVGSEATVKNEVARKHPSFRFSFSRRGFLTFRIPDEVARDRKFELNCAFARTWGFSLGKAIGTDGQQLARDFWKPFVERYPADVLTQFRHLHVWQRDRFVPGDSDFEPGITPLAEGIGELKIRLDDRFVDLDKPVRVIQADKTIFEGVAPRNIFTLASTLSGRGDPKLVFAAEVVVKLGEK